ncbi:amino acid ABC transporter permease [Streptococcus orisasini]|uniref:amino acid ABC transporter permease n=1 Tax=Streptococcus orisasini TaxID=1080071 RepID=UPI00070B0590|nr:amino acid ABC transporter permease [Streptococcus orisasini]
MNINYMITVFPILLSKIPVSLFVFLLSELLSLILASLMAYIRIKRILLLEQICSVFVSFARSVPGIIHIFIIYYGVPAIFSVFAIDFANFNKIVSAVISLVLYQGATVSEILRPVYLSIPKGQYEAGVSMGLSVWQVNRRIIIPQMLPIALPSLGNASVDLMKYTSLLFLIGLTDIMGQADNLVSNSYGIYQLEVYVLVALIYWFFSVIIGNIVRILEKISSNYLLN